MFYKIFYPKDIHSPGVMACGKLRSLSLTTIHCNVTVCRCWKPVLAQNLYSEHKESTAFLDGLSSCCALRPHTDICNIYILPSILPASLHSCSVAALHFSGNKTLLATKNTPGPSKENPSPPNMPKSLTSVCLKSLIQSLQWRQDPPANKLAFWVVLCFLAPAKAFPASG